MTTSFHHINTTSGTLGRKVTFTISAIAVIVIICTGIGTNRVASCDVIDSEVAGSSYQLEEILILTEFEIVIRGEQNTIIIFMYIAITDRHEIRLIARIVITKELDFLRHCFKTPSRSCIIGTIMTDYSTTIVYASIHIPTWVTTIRLYCSRKDIKFILSSSEVRNNIPICVGFVFTIDKFCLVSSFFSVFVRNKLAIRYTEEFVNRGFVGLYQTEFRRTLTRNTYVVTFQAGIPSSIPIVITYHCDCKVVLSIGFRLNHHITKLGKTKHAILFRLRNAETGHGEKKCE